MLITGKGGVGKTVVAAAVGRMLADHGRRVLLAELSPDETVPSRIGEVFGRHITSDAPVELSPNLFVTLLTPSSGHRRFLEDVLPAKLIANAAMRSGAIRRFLSAAPAFGEMGVLYRLLDLARQKRSSGALQWDALVVDLPATGHALALAQVPHTLLSVVPGGPIGTAVKEGLGLLSDPSRTAAFVVTLLEPLPVTESIELVTGISRHHIPFGGMIANRAVREALTEEQDAALREALAATPNMLGARLLRQAERTRALTRRLSREVPHRITLLDELPARGPELVERAAKVLAEASWQEPVR